MLFTVDFISRVHCNAIFPFPLRGAFIIISLAAFFTLLFPILLSIHPSVDEGLIGVVLVVGEFSVEFRQITPRNGADNDFCFFLSFLLLGVSFFPRNSSFQSTSSREAENIPN